VTTGAGETGGRAGRKTRVLLVEDDYERASGLKRALNVHG
jgi:hypothetical protein